MSASLGHSMAQVDNPNRAAEVVRFSDWTRARFCGWVARLWAPRRRLQTNGGSMAGWAGTLLSRALIVSLALIAVWASDASAAACPTMQVYGVRGSGETSQDADGFGRTVKSVVDRVKRANPSAIVDAVDYDAIPVNILDPSYRPDYRASVRSGHRALQRSIRAFVAGPCGNETFVYLVGYSQGAHVVADVYQGHVDAADVQDKLTTSERARIAGIALLGDPRFFGAETGINVGDFDAGRNGVDQWNGAVRRFSEGQRNQVRSYCKGGDPVCNYTAGAALGCKKTGRNCAHSRYPELRVPGLTLSYTQAAGDFLVSRWRSVGPAQPPRLPGGGPILVFGADSEISDRYTHLVSMLQGAGYSVEHSVDLPADLNGYGQVWWYGLGLSTSDQDRLVDFARRGGGLYLTGEWSNCCQSPSNSSVVASIFDRLVVTVGGLGIGSDQCGGADISYVNALAVGALTSIPNRLASFRGSCVGTISPSNLSTDNLVVTIGGAGRAPTTIGAWDAGRVVGGGRLVVVMDINWAEPTHSEPLQARYLAENAASFLDGPPVTGATRARPQGRATDGRTSTYSMSSAAPESAARSNQADSGPANRGTRAADFDPFSATISGTARNGAGLPATNICVRAYDGEGEEVGLAFTDEDGKYTIDRLGAGLHRVGFADCGDSGLLPVYYPTSSDLGSATTISSVPGAAVDGIDVQMLTGGAVAGRVVGETGAAVSGACVLAYDADGRDAGVAFTNANGDFAVRGLQSGGYRLRYEDCTTSGVLGRFAGGGETLETATAFTVVAGESRGAGSTSLPSGGTLSGRVTDDAGVALQDICVIAYDGNSQAIAFTFTDQTGAYAVNGLAGQYRLEFDDCGQHGVSGMIYAGKETLAEGDIFTVAPGATVAVPQVRLARIGGAGTLPVVPLPGPPPSSATLSAVMGGALSGPAPAKVTVRLAALPSSLRVRGGKVKVTCAAVQGKITGCRATLTVRGKTIASVSGSNRQLTLKLNSAGRKLLRKARGKRLSAKLSLIVQTATGPMRVTKSVKIRS